MTKPEIRKLYREKRLALSAAETATASRAIADRFFDDFDLARLKILHTFIRIARHNEIDTSVIYYRVWRDFPKTWTLAPRIDRATAAIENLVFDADTEFVENAWGIREPVRGAAVRPADIDLILVPLVGFDEAGHRIGYGKGFYDRLLASCREDCQKVGLSIFPPVERIDDVGDHDIRLDACVTPERTYRWK